MSSFCADTKITLSGRARVLLPPHSPLPTSVNRQSRFSHPGDRGARAPLKRGSERQRDTRKRPSEPGQSGLVLLALWSLIWFWFKFSGCRKDSCCC
ncbi:hypothetical protein GN956_G4274 [Arapaima gigas]